MEAAAPSTPVRKRQLASADVARTPSKARKTKYVEQLPPGSHVAQKKGGHVGVFNIYDRSVNLGAFPPNASLYALCRAWIQDDPTRQAPPLYTPLRFRDTKDRTYDDQIKGIVRVLAPEVKSTPKEEILNSMPSVPAAELLQSHVAYLKNVRKAWKRVNAFKYAQYRAHLESLGVPVCRGHQRILDECAETTEP